MKERILETLGKFKKLKKKYINNLVRAQKKGFARHRQMIIICVTPFRI